MRQTYASTDAARRVAPKEAFIGDRLPYAGHLDEATIRTRDGLLIQVLHLRGFPFETQPDEELNYRKSVRETLPVDRAALWTPEALAAYQTLGFPLLARLLGYPWDPVAS